MRIISDITGKTYPSVEECLKAEQAYQAEQKKIKFICSYTVLQGKVQLL